MRKVTKIEDSNLDTLGKRITYLRTNMGMSQQELADKLNIKRQKLSYIETDMPDRQLTLDELFKLSEIFNVSCDYLLGKTIAKNVDNAYISSTLNLTDESIDLIKKYNFDNYDKLTNDFLERISENEFMETLYFYNNCINIRNILFESHIFETLNNEDTKKLFDNIFNGKSINSEDITKLCSILYYMGCVYTFIYSSLCEKYYYVTDLSNLHISRDKAKELTHKIIYAIYILQGLLEEKPTKLTEDYYSRLKWFLNTFYCYSDKKPLSELIYTTYIVLTKDILSLFCELCILYEYSLTEKFKWILSKYYNKCTLDKMPKGFDYYSLFNTINEDLTDSSYQFIKDFQKRNEELKNGNTRNNKK